MQPIADKPIPTKRCFLPEDFKVTNWEALEPFYSLLRNREITSLAALKQWLVDRSELEGVIEEYASWCYIHTTCDTSNKEAKEAYEQYVKYIVPPLVPVAHALDHKLIQSPYTKQLAEEPQYKEMLRAIETSMKLYRVENIPLLTNATLEAQQYGEIVSQMTITRDGKQLTLQQAALHLESTDRKVREEVYTQIHVRRLKDEAALDALYSGLVHKRHQIAQNAGFESFRDYAFLSLQRFDYTPVDCFTLHQAIQEAVIPVLNELAQRRKAQLQLSSLRPWDHAVDPANRPPLRPFSDTAILIEKATQVLGNLDPYFGNCLRIMAEMKRLDLDSRHHKAPGGYNISLEETGVPFIFMNAVNDLDNVITILHESGHAVHSFLMHQLPLNSFKHITSETAELASMSMELMTMDHWDVFFPKAADAARAKQQFLETLIQRLAWIACIDKFQHWIYTNPQHTVAERQATWQVMVDAFSDQVTDWRGYEHIKYTLWQRQLHLFEVPFYYIEYAIAQLGSISLWKNYKQDPKQALHHYKEALSLGYTCSLSQMYETAGIALNFKPAYVQDLISFLWKEWQKLA